MAIMTTEHTDESAAESSSDKFAESTNLKYGVAEDSIPESDIYRTEENPVILLQYRDDGEYWLRIGSRVGLDSGIAFDSVRWGASDYTGTLWFKRDGVTTGNLDWSVASPRNKLGLVGEWFLERLDLSEYRTGFDCPKCEDEVIHLRMSSACLSPDCDFFCEGHLDPTIDPEAVDE